MAAVKNLLAVQESMMRSVFESMVSQISSRVDDLVEKVSGLKASLEFTQSEVERFGPINKKVKETDSEVVKVKDALEYLENQSRRNNKRVSGIPESPGESWADSEAKVKKAIQTKLGLEIGIERAHRVERKKAKGRSLTQSEKERPRTIVCKLKDWKTKEAVVRKARIDKPAGLYVAEDLARATLLKREAKIEEMKKARAEGKRAYFILDLIIRDQKQDAAEDRFVLFPYRSRPCLGNADHHHLQFSQLKGLDLLGCKQGEPGQWSTLHQPLTTRRKLSHHHQP
ncbi:uncharacterized protein LOC116615509 isoform X3 [Nematostella vectensis]|nr:uncharacterized protein LOC116615509 isoform X3 [Nematostella vectensis]